MMSPDEVYQAAYEAETQQPGYHISTDAMRAAADAGLQDGDRIGLGSGLVATIHGDEVEFGGERGNGQRVPLASLSEQQVDTMRVHKARRAGIRGVSMGSL